MTTTTTNMTPDQCDGEDIGELTVARPWTGTIAELEARCARLRQEAGYDY